VFDEELNVNVNMDGKNWRRERRREELKT
jgi:hypothetical protein